MANDTYEDWDETAPALGDARRNGAAEIRALRAGIRHRMSREHNQMLEVDGSGGEGGEHKSGSAKMYHQASAPTTRPDGTALDGNDQGRLWYKHTTRELYVWDGGAWDLIASFGVTVSAVSLTLAQVASSGGWQNTSGSPVLVNFTCSRSGSTEVYLQIDYNNDGTWTTVGIANLIDDYRFMFVNVLVPDDAKIRTSPTDVSGLGGYAQKISFGPWNS